MNHEDPQAPQAPRSGAAAEGPIDVTPSHPVAEGRQSPGPAYTPISALENIVRRFDTWDAANLKKGFPEGSMAWAMASDAREALKALPATPSQEEGPAGVDLEALADEIMREIPNNDLDDSLPKLAEDMRRWAHGLRYARLRAQAPASKENQS